MFDPNDLLRQQLEQVAERPSRAKRFKPVPNPKRIASQYNAALRQLVEAVRKDINERVIPMIKALEPVYAQDMAFNDGWATDIANVFQQLMDKWNSPAFSGAARQTAQEFVSQLNSANLRRFQRNAQSFGIDVFGDSPQLQELIELSAIDNARLIKTIPEQYLNQVQSIVTSNMKSGLRPSNIVGQLSEQFGVTRRRAALIARDQTSKINGEISKVRQTSTGFEFFRWVDSDDERVRDRHEAISKQDVGYGPGVYRWDDPPKNEKGQSIIPGQEINCFPGDTELSGFTGINKIFRRRYAGELTEIISDSGESFKSTPNHEFLTGRGWVPANCLKIGDEIIKSRNSRAVISKGVIDNRISIEDIFSSVSVVAGFESIDGLASDFHGDGTINENVNIVRSTTGLMDAIEPGTFKAVKNLFLHWSSMRFSDFPGLGSFDPLRNRFLLSSDGCISFFRDFLPFIRRELVHSIEHCLASVSGGDPISLKEFANGLSLTSDSFGDFLDAIPRQIFSDDRFIVEMLGIVWSSVDFGYGEPNFSELNAEVIGANVQSDSGFSQVQSFFEKGNCFIKEIRSEFFSGHVYNLESENNWYSVSDRIVTHNCRCVAQPVTRRQIENS